MKKQTQTASSSDQIPDFEPGSYSNKTRKRFFEAGKGQQIEKNRFFLIVILQGILNILFIVALINIFPLKSVETYQVNKVEGGRLVADSTPVGTWAPDSDSIAYFINKWGNEVFDINRSTIEQTLASSSEIAIGSAVDQLKELRSKENPLVLLRENSELTRTYDFITCNFIKDDVVLLRFKLTTRVPGRTIKTGTYAMTITFTRVKPKTKEQVVKNPAGIFITNFNLKEE